MQASTGKPKNNRLKWMVLGGCLLCAAAYGYVEFTYARPIGDGPAGPPVPLEPFEQTWTEARIELLGIGDSVTAGLGAKSPAHSYFQRLLFNPPDEYEDMSGKCLSRVLPNLTFDNRAISGTTSLHHAEVVRELEPREADVFGLVVMTSGGNDIIHNYGRGEPREGAMYGATFE